MRINRSKEKKPYENIAVAETIAGKYTVNKDTRLKKVENMKNKYNKKEKKNNV